MPIYEYHCLECDTKFEKLQSFSAGKTCNCPDCGKTAKRVISLGSFVLKGSGWYVTEHPSKSRQMATRKEKSVPDPGPAKPASSPPKTETKTPAAAPAKSE